MKISAALLAGGESRRFGQDKALFPWNGEPLWKRQLSILRETGCEEIILSARTDPSWRPREIDFAADAQPPCGPIGGLFAGLAAMRGSHLLALAVDMPFMTSGYLKSLMGLVTPACGVVPVLNDEPEPLAAIYPREAAETVAEAIRQRSDVSLRGLIAKLVSAKMMLTQAVGPNESLLFQNINKPDDLTNRSRTS